jgi:hypothetical protein
MRESFEKAMDYGGFSAFEASRRLVVAEIKPGELGTDSSEKGSR